MKEKLNFEFENELSGALRDVVRQHPLKKIFQEEEARIRRGGNSDTSPTPGASGGGPVVSLWRRLASIAAVLVAVGFSGYYVWQQFFQEPPLAVLLMEMPEPAAKADQEAVAVFLKATDAFFSEDYKSAVSLLSRIPQSSDYYQESQYLLAHAYHHLTNFKEAIRIYNGFLTNPEAYISLPPKYRNQSLRWNLSLAYWGDQNKTMALKELARFKQEIGNNAKWNKKIELFEKELLKGR